MTIYCWKIRFKRVIKSTWCFIHVRVGTNEERQRVSLVIKGISPVNHFWGRVLHIGNTFFLPWITRARLPGSKTRPPVRWIYGSGKQSVKKLLENRLPRKKISKKERRVALGIVVKKNKAFEEDGRQPGWRWLRKKIE